MKGLNVKGQFVLIAFLGLSVSAQAAPSKGASSAPSKSAASVTSSSASNADDGEGSSSDSTSSGSNSISTSVGTTPWSRMMKDVNFAYFNLTNLSSEQFYKGAGRPFAYNYFALDYRIGRGWKASLRPVFLYTWGGTEYGKSYQASEFKIGDAYGVLGYKFRRRPETDLDSKINFRVYAPTSDGSREQGLVTRIRPEIVFEQWFGDRFSFEARLEPDYYVQSKTAFLTADNKVLTTKNWGYETFVGPIWYFYKDFGAQLSVGYDQMNYHDSEANNKFGFKDEKIKYQASVKGTVGPLFFIAGATQKRNVLKEERAFQAFHERETEFFLFNYWSL